MANGPRSSAETAYFHETMAGIVRNMRRFPPARRPDASAGERAMTEGLGILERLDRGVVLGDGGHLLELEKRGYVKAGPFTPEHDHTHEREGGDRGSGA